MCLKKIISKTALIIISLVLISYTNKQWSQEEGIIFGKVTSEKDVPVEGVQIIIKQLNLETYTDKSGNFILTDVPYGKHKVEFISEFFVPEHENIDVNSKNTNVQKTLLYPVKVLEQLEVFGAKENQPDKLDAITSLPLLPTEQ